jgi:hypothetical protein
MQEIFKDIPNFEGRYQISNFGKVKSIYFSHRIIKNTISKQGYYYVRLFVNNKKSKFFIHRLIANAFIPNPENKPQVNHIDGNKLNFNLNNLEWCTGFENMQHAHKNNLIKYRNLKIIQVDKNKQVIKKHNSIKEAAIFLGNIKYDSNIVKCLKGKLYYAYGFKWLYA